MTDLYKLSNVRSLQFTLAIVVMPFFLGCALTTNHDQAATGGLLSSQGNYYVVFSTSPSPLPLNSPFTMNVLVYDGKTRGQAVPGASLEVDARMPHHRHGMNRVPKVLQNDDGTFFVDGMLLHMSGYWELYFDVTRNGRTERAQTSVTLD